MCTHEQCHLLSILWTCHKFAGVPVMHGPSVTNLCNHHVVEFLLYVLGASGR